MDIHSVDDNAIIDKLNIELNNTSDSVYFEILLLDKKRRFWFIYNYFKDDIIRLSHYVHGLYFNLLLTPNDLVNSSIIELEKLIPGFAQFYGKISFKKYMINNIIWTMKNEAKSVLTKNNLFNIEFCELRDDLLYKKDVETYQYYKELDIAYFHSKAKKILSNDEFELVSKILDGKTIREVANNCGGTTSTIKSRLIKIMKILGYEYEQNEK